MSTLGRRLLTLPAIFLLAGLMVLSAPVWLIGSLLAALCMRGARAAPRVFAFITVYLWCEVIGVIVAFWLWLRHGAPNAQSRDEDWQRANHALQVWWCSSLRRAAGRLFRLRFDIQDTEQLTGDGVILLPRHCSIGDTIIPIVFYAQPFHRRLRFVLKRELLFDPCLDIVGNRLPNYFADRSATDTAREADGVRALTQNLPADTAIVIYPEGTRFTPARREALIRRFEETGNTQTLERARRWTQVLPPRPAGTLALLDGNPGRDVVFCAHTGFEDSASFAALFNGSWLDTQVRIRFWRVPHAEIPRTSEDRLAFLNAQWERMNDTVVALRATT